MTLLIIIAATTAFLALLSLPKISDKYARWITIALAVTTGLSLVPNAVLSYDGFVGHAIALFISGIYVFFPRDLEFSLQKKALILVTIALPLITMTLELYRPPGIPQMGYLCSVSVACFSYILIREPANYKNEMGILIVAAGDSFVRLGIGIIAISGQT